MSDLNLYSVNWRDGMVISNRHLFAQEAYLESVARWYAREVSDRWGLVQKSADGVPAVSMNLSLSGNRLRIDIDRLTAITSAGHIIDIDSQHGRSLSGEADIANESVPVYVAIDPSSKRESGDPDPDEQPPRLPYRTATYSLHIGQAPSVSAGCMVPIARLARNGSEIVPQPNYYPPCVSLFADERLNQKASEFRNRLENLLSLSSKAYQSMAAGSLGGSDTRLQNEFVQTIRAVITYLAGSLDTFIVGRNAGHPIDMVITFRRLFRIFVTLMNLHPGLKDYLNERYLTKEAGTDVGTFMATIDGFLLTEYNHQDIGAHVAAIEKNLDALRGVFRFLAQVERDQLGDQAVATDTLTYGGKTYRVAEYSSVRVEQMGELTYVTVDLAESMAMSKLVVLLNRELFMPAQWNNMRVRLGLNEARGLGETDPVDIDTVAYGNKVVLHPQDMMKSPSVSQLTLIISGAGDTEKLAAVGKMDLIVYAI